MCQKLHQVPFQITYLQGFFPPYKCYIKDNGHNFEYLKPAIARETQYWEEWIKNDAQINHKALCK